MRAAEVVAAEEPAADVTFQRHAARVGIRRVDRRHPAAQAGDAVGRITGAHHERGAVANALAPRRERVEGPPGSLEIGPGRAGGC